MLESDRIKRLQSRVIYASYLIEKDSNSIIRKLNITSGDLIQNISSGPTSFTPVELNDVLIQNNVFIPELLTESGMSVPTPPRNLNGILGNNDVILTWSPPESNGGSSITGYRVTSSTGEFDVSGLTATITGLTNGQAYTFTVVAINAIGTSVPSSISVTPGISATVPSAPTGVTGVAGNQQVTLSWTAPNNGGSPITSYTVTSNLGGFTTSETSVTITGLTNGQLYTFTVVASNAVGTSVPSSVSVTPATVPSAPGLTAIGGNQQVALSWTAPNNGGSPITGYRISSSAGDVDVSGVTTTITGLTNGQSYTFTVVAINSIGTSVPSAGVSVTPATVPSAPGLTAIGGNQQVALSWTAPNNGGSPITSYRVTSSPGEAIDVSGLTATITSLTNGQSYTFTVVAINSIGTSVPSAGVSVTPATVPSAPTGLTAIGGNQQVALSWTAPNNGGSPITGYRVTSSTGDFDVSGVTATITGLTNGQSYTFTVVAINSIGSSVPSSVSVTLTISLEPTVLKGVAGIQQVALSWTELNNVSIVAYRIISSPGEQIVNVSGNVNTATITGLTNGQLYKFTLSAINIVGFSLPLASISLTPGDVPSAPYGLIGFSGNQQVRLNWVPPNNGGSPITGYRVTSSSGVFDVSGTIATVTGLTNGISYTFTVVAINAIGASVPSSVLVTPVNVPGAPSGATAIKGNTTALVSWNVPVSDGGTQITEYTVISTPESITSTTDAVSRSAILTNLLNGISYTFRVIATNAAGSSVPSTESNSITPTTVPDSPTNVTGVAGFREVTLSWNAPTNSAVTSYTVTSQTGITSTTDTTITLTNLISEAYTFTVIATNAQGNSLPSLPSAQIVPYDLPLAPTNVTALKGNTSALVSWTASNGRGSNILSYTVTSIPGSFTTTTDGALSATITGLTNGTSYTFTVIAANLAGDSLPSTSNSVTPTTVPDSPTDVSVLAGVRQATLSWNIQGIAEITSYRITSQPGGVTATTDLTTYTLTGLTAGLTYSFTIVAINIEGDSLPAVSPDVILPDVTGPPTNVTVTAGDTIANLIWSQPVYTLPPIFYTVTSSPGGFTSTTGGDETTATVFGLTNGTSYTFTVISINSVGNSAPSLPTAPIIIGVVPDAPTNISSVPSDGQVTLSWAMNYTGTSPITKYTINTDQGYFAIVNAMNLTGTVTGLVNNTNYIFTVTATNSTGDSLPSNQIASIPSSIPGAPQRFAVILTGGNSVILLWDSPLDYVTIHRINVYDASNNLLPEFNTDIGYQTYLQMSGFSLATLYKFTIKAVNDVGEGPPASVSKTIYNYPSTINFTGIRGDGQVTISWTPPTDNGGKAIVSYTVNVYDANDILLDKTKDVSANIITTIITGLTNGTLYKFSVSVSNGALSNNSSELINIVPGRAPSTPTPSILAGYDFIDIGWPAPYNGGYIITSYTVRVFDLSDVEIPELNKQVNIPSATILTSGSYKFSVDATNNIGTSAQSSKVTASTTSISVPAAPQSVSTTPGIDQVTVNWSAPLSNGGSAITGYTVTVYDTSNNIVRDVSDTILTTTFTLTSGIRYTFTVTAINEIGIGTPSIKIPGIPQNVPGPLVDLSGIFYPAGDGVLTWSPPSNTGGLPITSYTLDGEDIGLLVEPISQPIVAFFGATAYTYVVRAVNAIGIGASSTITIYYIIIPSSLTNIQTQVGNTEIYIQWQPPNNGGSPITTYTILLENTDDDTFIEYDISGTKTSELITGLINGRKYRVSIKANNIVGSSSYTLVTLADSAELIPIAVSKPPTNVTGVLSTNGITVSWTPPTDQGGSFIRGYTVINSENNELRITTSTSIIFTEIVKGQTYTFRVFARNIQGNSIYSLPSQPILVPLTKPDVITVGESTYREITDEIYLTWTPPNNGGSSITSYTVTPNVGEPIIVDSSITSIYISSPTAGVTYSFTITATNAVGTSDPSAPFTVTPPSITIPAKITNITTQYDEPNNEIIVSWTAPNSDSPITSYTVTSNQNEIITTELTSTTFTLLTNGLPYTFTVIATNAIGNSEASDPTPTIYVGIRPQPPTDVTGISGYTQATISWTVPADSGSFPIINYRVTSNPEGLFAVTDTTTATVTGLTNGNYYTFTVVATNLVGDSFPSQRSSPVFPGVRLVPPTNVTAVLDSTTVTTAYVSWDAPVLTSETLPPFVYNITSNPGDITVATGGGEETTYYVSGLTLGITYTFTVVAINQVGSSDPSLQSNPVTPANAPDSPINVIALPANNKVLLSWTAPYTGGSTITTYTVTSDVGEVNVNTNQTTLFIEVTNGTPYIFAVVATNAVGTSASSFSNTVTPTTVPDSPINVTAVAGISEATVSWDPPENIVGSAIISYTVSSNGITEITSDTTFIFTGLTAGLTYTFTVIATNLEGNSLPSLSNSVIPVNVPDRVQNVVLIPDNGQVTISWTAPFNSGSEIINYTITSGPDITVTVTGLTAIISGLTNGTPYVFTIVATNAIGNSEPFISEPVSPSNIPDSPTDVTGIPGIREATASWTPPVNTRGSPITGYIVNFIDTVTSTTTSITTTSTLIDIPNLIAGRTYSFTVNTTTELGVSAPSEIVYVILSDVTYSPTNLSVIARNTMVIVSWEPPLSRPYILPPISYTVTSNPGGFTTITTTTTAEVTGLTNGSSYTFTVIATNLVGDSLPSEPSFPAIPGFAPDPPLDVIGVPGNGQISISWTAPDPGSLPITNYIVTLASVIIAYVDANTRNIVAVDLINGTSYSFAVIARSDLGDSEVSLPSDPVTPFLGGLTRPEPPTDVTGIPSDGQITLEWTPPNSSIISYTVRSEFTDINVTTNLTNAIITGLTNYNPYVFRVIATNSFGNSLQSEPSAYITPGLPPGTPTNIVGIVGDGQVELSWTCETGPLPIIYSITVSPGGIILNTDLQSIIVTGLTNETPYTFTIIATNSIGNSPSSTSDPFIPTV